MPQLPCPQDEMAQRTCFSLLRTPGAHCPISHTDTLCIGFFPFPVSLPLSPPGASTDRLPSKWLVLKSLSQGLLLGDPISDITLAYEHFLTVYFVTLGLLLPWFLGKCATALRFISSPCPVYSSASLIGWLPWISWKSEMWEHWAHDTTQQKPLVRAPFSYLPHPTLINISCWDMRQLFFTILTFGLQMWFVHYRKFNKFI